MMQGRRGEENLERSERTWPAEFMVERFVEIVKLMASSDSRLWGVRLRV